MTTRALTCKCGKVRFAAIGEPVLVGVCYCDDCQAGARMIEALPDAPPALDEDGGASYLTFRDDRFRCVSGEEFLKPVKLKENSKTYRQVATCCNSAIYVKFRPGHWVSTFRNRYTDDLPAIEMRTQTRYRSSELPFPDNAPTYKRFPLRLFAKLIKARYEMLIGQ